MTINDIFLGVNTGGSSRWRDRYQPTEASCRFVCPPHSKRLSSGESLGGVGIDRQNEGVEAGDLDHGAVLNH